MYSGDLTNTISITKSNTVIVITNNLITITISNINNDE